eukprot:1138679-Pelagomonas_calceolata.AAC.2
MDSVQRRAEVCRAQCSCKAQAPFITRSMRSASKDPRTCLKHNYTPELFPQYLPERSRLTSSRPDAILITRCKAKPTSFSPFTSCSHRRALRSRHNLTLRTTTANRVRQPQQLSVNQRHVHLIEIKYCEDTRPGQQLEAAKQQHADPCKSISGKVPPTPRKERKEKLCRQGENSLHQSRKRRRWLKRNVKLHHKAIDLKVLVGIWRVTGSTLLPNLAVISTKLTGKLNGTLVVQHQFFELAKGMLSVSRPTNTPENAFPLRSKGLHAAAERPLIGDTKICHFCQMILSLINVLKAGLPDVVERLSCASCSLLPISIMTQRLAKPAPIVLLLRTFVINLASKVVAFIPYQK